MPALANPRHERFCQELYRGKSQQEAYALARYRPHASNPSKLAKDQRIIARLAELSSDRAKIDAMALEKAAEAVGVDKAWVMGRLVENVERAMNAVPVTDREGGLTGEYKYDGAVANKALELLGREFGMFVTRSEVGKPGDFSRMNDAELREFIEARAGRASRGLVRARSEDGSGEAIEPERRLN